MTIRAVLFDFDGTLADSNELIARSHLHVLDEYFPGRFDREKVKEFNGPPLEETYGKLNPEKTDEMIASFRAYNRAHHDEMLTLFPDVKEVLEALHTQAFKLAIVSAKRRDVLNKGLRLVGIDDAFDELIGSGEYEKAKPNPEALLKVTERLKIPASDCIMVGDSLADIGAAHAAGMRCIFVGWSEKPVATIPLKKEDIVVESMLELAAWLKENK